MRNSIYSSHLTSAAVPLRAVARPFDGVLMTNEFSYYKSISATFGVVLPFAALVWFFAVPEALSAVSFVALTLVAVSAALVAVNTWRNGQPTRNMDHVLYQAESPVKPPATSADGRA